MAALSSFVVTCNDRYALDCKDGVAGKYGGNPEYVYHDRTAWRCAVVVGKKLWQQRISTKKCCPCTVNIACHVKQSSKTTSFGGKLS